MRHSKRQTTLSRLQDKIDNLLLEKNLIEEKFVLAIDSDGNDCADERVRDIEFEIEDIEGIISELKGS